MSASWQRHAERLHHEERERLKERNRTRSQRSVGLGAIFVALCTAFVWALSNSCEVRDVASDPRREGSIPDDLPSTVERLAASLHEEQLFSIARIYGRLVDILEWFGGISTAFRRRRHS